MRTNPITMLVSFAQRLTATASTEKSDQRVYKIAQGAHNKTIQLFRTLGSDQYICLLKEFFLWLVTSCGVGGNESITMPDFEVSK